MKTEYMGLAATAVCIGLLLSPVGDAVSRKLIGGPDDVRQVSVTPKPEPGPVVPTSTATGTRSPNGQPVRAHPSYPAYGAAPPDPHYDYVPWNPLAPVVAAVLAAQDAFNTTTAAIDVGYRVLMTLRSGSFIAGVAVGFGTQLKENIETTSEFVFVHAPQMVKDGASVGTVAGVAVASVGSYFTSWYFDGKEGLEKLKVAIAERRDYDAGMIVGRGVGNVLPSGGGPAGGAALVRKSAQRASRALAVRQMARAAPLSSRVSNVQLYNVCKGKLCLGDFREMKADWEKSFFATLVHRTEALDAIDNPARAAVNASRRPQPSADALREPSPVGAGIAKVPDMPESIPPGRKITGSEPANTRAELEADVESVIDMFRRLRGMAAPEP